MSLIIRSQLRWDTDSRHIAIFDRRPDGRRAVAKPLEFTIIDDSDLVEAPTIDDRGNEFLQAVLNHAWDLGLRPAGFNDTTQQVKALSAHLKDMRSLVFKKTPDDL